MAYNFEQVFAADPSNPANIAQNASITIFAPGDATQTPITLTDPSGSPLPNPMPVNANGFGPAFISDLDRVGWSGGGFTGFFTSYEGLKEEAVAARTAAETAAATAGADAAAVAEAAIAGATDEATAAAASAATAASNASASATAAANAAALVGAPADSAIAAAVNNGASATKAALNATIASVVPPAVAAAVADNQTVADAAAAAVTNALVSNKLSITLVERPSPATPVSAPLTVFSGTPAYAAGKFGNAVKGATLLTPTLADQSGDYTIEFWFHLATAPGFTKVLMDVPGFYLGLGAAGQLYLTDPAGVTGPNICDGLWHHIAIGYRRVAATSRIVTGVWVDGTKIINQTASANQAAWYQWSLGGFHASAGSEARNVSFDDFRISFGTTGRYTTDTFTVPTTAATLDASAILLAPLDSLAATKPGVPGALGYDARPSSAPSGMVTYIGTTTPTDALTRDRWIQA